MAVQFWKEASLLLGANELATTAKAFTLNTEVQELDVTPISTTGWTEVIGGLKSGTVDIELMSEFADGGPDAPIWSNLGSAGVAQSIVTNVADGSAAYTFSGIPLTYTILQGSVGDVAMSQVSGASSSSPVVRGKLLHPTSTARTSSGTGTGRQLGAVTASQSVYAALHVTAASGSSPTLDVIVQSDDNAGFTTPTSRVTFTQATDTTSEFLSTAGAITDDYWRISYTIGGSTPSFTFAVVVGIL